MTAGCSQREGASNDREPRVKTASRTAQPRPPPLPRPTRWACRLRGTPSGPAPHPRGPCSPSRQRRTCSYHEKRRLSSHGRGLACPGPPPHLGDGRAAALTPQLLGQAGHVHEHFSGNHIRYFFYFFKPSEGGGGREVSGGRPVPGRTTAGRCPGRGPHRVLRGRLRKPRRSRTRCGPENRDPPSTHEEVARVRRQDTAPLTGAGAARGSGRPPRPPAARRHLSGRQLVSRKARPLSQEPHSGSMARACAHLWPRNAWAPRGSATCGLTVSGCARVAELSRVPL